MLDQETQIEIRMAQIRMAQMALEMPTPTVGKDMEQPELCCTGGWSVNCYHDENKYKKIILEGLKNEQFNQKRKSLRIR